MPDTKTSDSSSLLRRGETVWRLARAERAAVLLDGAEYFGALRSALLQARQSISFIGWDIDSRTRLRGAGHDPADDAPETLREFLRHLVERRGDLVVRVLLWDYSILYALEREPLPSLNLDWRTPAQIVVALDDALPGGASHHQKLVVIDDTLAFCGGLDVTVNRWDTSDHAPDNPERASPGGESYGPFHDAQMVVDGEAAGCLAELARYRWRRATDERIKPIQGADPVWPEGVQPDFESVDIGIARTLPDDDDQQPVSEICELYEESIRRARRYIYVENQYLTVLSLADALVEALENAPELEAVIVTPDRPQGWLETKTMGVGQARFMARLDDEALRDRVRFCYPSVGAGEKETAVMVHAKIMIVDDRLIRVGSANLNHRSMALDTECDLAIEANDDREQQAIHAMLCRLLAHHLGHSEDGVSSELATRRSVIGTVDALNSPRRGLRRLQPATEYDDIIADTLNAIADREAPLGPETLFGDMFDAGTRRRGLRRAVRLIVVALALAGLVIAWHYTPLAKWTDPENIATLLESFRANRWSVPVLLGAYVVGGIVMFPLTALVTVTGMVLGPWTGFLCAITGSLASAAAGFGLGRITGKQTVRHILGKRYRTLRRAVSKGGLFTITAVRMVPVAPYTVVNMTLGALGIRLWPYLAGTLLGLLPGVLALTVLGDRLLQAWRNPDLANTGWLLLAVAVWLGLALGLHRVGTRLERD
jgi:phospholipase D1/2